MLPATVVERARAALKRHSLLTAVIMFLFFAAMPFSGSSAMAAGEVSTSAKSYMLLEAEFCLKKIQIKNCLWQVQQK